MVLTAAQTTAFFENPDQLGIPHENMVQIQREGIQLLQTLQILKNKNSSSLQITGGSLEEEFLTLIQMQHLEQQSQHQHSHMEPSLRRG